MNNPSCRLFSCSGARGDAIPPRTNAGHYLVIAIDHLDRLTITGCGIGKPQRTRLGVIFRRQPTAIVAPYAWPFFALVSLPAVDVDRPRPPAILDHECRRRPCVKRCD